MTRNHEVSGSIPGLAQWVKDLVFPMSYGVSHRHGLDPAMPWLRCRLAAVARIRPLAWEPPYAVGVALEKTKKKKKFSPNLMTYITPSPLLFKIQEFGEGSVFSLVFLFVFFCLLSF